MSADDKDRSLVVKRQCTPIDDACCMCGTRTCTRTCMPVMVGFICHNAYQNDLYDIQTLQAFVRSKTILNTGGMSFKIQKPRTYRIVHLKGEPAFAGRNDHSETAAGNWNPAAMVRCLGWAYNQLDHSDKRRAVLVNAFEALKADLPELQSCPGLAADR